MEPRKILLLDDDPVFLRIVERTVQSAGYETFKANQAQIASKILSENPIDCIISDYNMPGVTGVDFLKWIKKDYPHVIRIMLTGESDLEVAMRAINEGEVFRFLSKPFKPKMLITMIQEAFEMAEQQAAPPPEVDEAPFEEPQTVGKINELEEYFPGISQVSRSEDGAIIISEEEETLQDLEKLYPGITKI